MSAGQIANDGIARPSPPPADATQPPNGAGPSRGSTVDLHPHEWAWAAWRPLPDAPGLPEPFDPARAAAALRNARALETSWRWEWTEPPFTGSLTAEEATAWLLLARTDRRVTPTAAAQAMAGARQTTLERDAAAGLACVSSLPAGLAMAALLAVTSPEDIADWLLQEPPSPSRPGSRQREPRIGLVQGVRAFLLPRLTEADRARFADGVRGWLARVSWPLGPSYSYYDPPSLAFFLAAQLGLHDELERVAASWADDAYGGEEWQDHCHQPAAVVFGLGSPGAVREAFERLGLRFSASWHVAAWLAHTETHALDFAADRIARMTNRRQAGAALSVLARVHGEAAVRPMLDLVRVSRAPDVARQWLSDHSLDALVGSARMLSGSSGKSRDQALELLRARRRAGDDLDAALAHLDAPQAARLQELVLAHEDRAGRQLEPSELPPCLVATLGGVPAKKLPPWVDVASLPALPVGGAGRLGPDQVTAVLRGCASLTPEGACPPALAALTDHVDAESLDAFGWALFEAWLAEGAPSKGKWALLALGVLGGDRIAVRLAPMIRSWPGESQHQRAVLGLGALQAIGTDTALMLLSGIAQKVKFKVLQARAREAMDQIAVAKGMTKAELEDRIVPDCGLDASGSRVFDFGRRSFSFALGPRMKPMVRDESGKLRSALPKPGTRDDAQLASQAMADWTLLRRQVADVAKVQAARLEQAMITQRRWAVEDFERLLVRHPLQRHLVRLLVWGAWDGTRLVRTFRVTDELDCADGRDEPVALESSHLIGVVHPLQLDGATTTAWGELLADYEVVPPFAQLGRPVHDVDADDRTNEDITRFSERRVAAATLVRTLDNLGWQRGQPQDGGVFTVHAKPFPALDVTAVVEYGGVPVGYMVDWEDQAIEHCYVLDRALRSTHELGYGWTDSADGYRRLRWEAVDSIVRSEVLADVATLLEKAR